MVCAEWSVQALDWVLANLTEDGDEIVILRVIEPGSSAHAAWRAGEKGMEGTREEAEKVLELVMKKQTSILVRGCPRDVAGTGLTVWAMADPNRRRVRYRQRRGDDSSVSLTSWACRVQDLLTSLLM